MSGKLKVFLLFMICCMVGIVFLYKNPENSLQAKILEKWQDNSYIKISDLLHDQIYTVCVLVPYEDEIVGIVESKELVKMNLYLKDINYRGNEDRWSLITSSNSGVKLFEFNRQQLDTSHSSVIFHTRGFMPSRCIESNKGYLYLVERKGRKYSILGEKNEL